jgi:hypothetical protein
MDRQALVAKLAKCQYNPIQDQKALEAFSDEGLQSLDSHCASQAEKFAALEAEKKAADDEVTVLKGEKVSLEGKLRTAEADLRVAKKTPTEAEWLEQAPASIKTLIDRQKKQDDEKRDHLVGQLKTAQSEYTEEELKAMDIAQLERYARAFKVQEHDPVDYSGRETPQQRAAAGKEADVFLNPPNPYEEALKKMRENPQGTRVIS